MKKSMKWLMLLAATLMLAGFAAGCGGSKEPAQPAANAPAAPAATDSDLPAQVQAIKDAGVLRVGTKEDVPGFGLRNTATGEIEGLDADVCGHTRAAGGDGGCE